MLAIARRVLPPGIIRDYGKKPGTLSDIFGTVLAIHGLIADRSSDREAASHLTGAVVLCEIQIGHFFLADVASHHSSQQVVDLAEHRRIRRLLDSDHKFALVEYVGSAAGTYHERRIVSFHPEAVRTEAGRVGRSDSGFQICP